jgi:hypothetical protein
MRLVLDARTAAFAALIDYAGLFPPASLSMTEAVAEYRRIRSEEHHWVAGRFLCRASQLTELAVTATAVFPSGEVPWQVGVIFDGAPGESGAESIDFRAEMDPVMTIAAAEAKLNEPTSAALASLFDAMFSITPDIVAFIEVNRKTSITEQVTLVARELGGRRRVGGAKLRCGGITPDMFPTPAQVAEFVIACRNEQLPFKATAGLHEPIRHFDARLGAERHGFINILMAAALAEAGSDPTTIEDVIADTHVDGFSVSAAFASWRGNEIPGSALRRVRHSGFISYGSCDFDEPIDALAALGFLGGGT